MYHVFEDYYKAIWKISIDELPNKVEKVSNVYRYIFGYIWSVKSSLVANACTFCNVNRKYFLISGKNLSIINSE